MLGHIIRASVEDPLKIISFGGTRPWVPTRRRIGLPRQDWYEQTYNYAWTNILKRDTPTMKWEKYSNACADHIIQEVNESARNRKI